MKNSHEQPSQIFTTFLSISHIIISHEDSNVILLGVYGDLADGETKQIMVETVFQTLNDLISEEGGNEEVVDLISNALNNPTGETETIDVSDTGGLNFYKFFFPLQMILEEDDDIETLEPEDISYLLTVCVKIEKYLDGYWEFPIPENKKELVVYFNKILAMQYLLCLSVSQTTDKEKAFIISGLTNPILFAMAKTHFELDK